MKLFHDVVFREVNESLLPVVLGILERERMGEEVDTDQIKDCIQETLNPLGVAVVIEAKHLCMLMRGIQKQNSVASTSSFTGAFLKDSTRSEFISLISSSLS